MIKSNCGSRSLKIFKCSRATRIVVYLALVAALVTFLVIDTADERDRLVSFFGLVVFILLGFVFSKHPSRVSHVIGNCEPENDPSR
jgi:hypothetical protein